MLTALYEGAVAFRGVEFALAPVVAVLLAGVLIVLPLVLLRRWYFYRRRLRKSVITAEYEPPLGLNPAEASYFFHTKLKEREVAATLIFLIQKGYLHVKKSEGRKRIYAGPRVGDKLKEYERKLVELADRPEGATADELLERFTSYKSKKNDNAHASKPFVFTQLVNADLERNGYVKKNSFGTFMSTSLKITSFLLIVIVMLPLLFIWLSSDALSGATDAESLSSILALTGLIGLVLVIPLTITGMILCTLRGKALGREWIITKKLKAHWPQIASYRQYVQLVEKGKLEFQSKELEKASRNDTLAYAVALGFVKNWRDIIS